MTSRAGKLTLTLHHDSLPSALSFHLLCITLLYYRAWLQQVFPIGIFMGLSLAAGNCALLYLSLSFIQMMKSIGPVTVYIILQITGLERFHLMVCLSVMVIVSGCVVAAYGELHLSVTGLTLIVIAELNEGTKNAAMQFLLANKKFSMWEGMYFFSPASFSVGRCKLTLA